jgi:hypothetical protein
MTFARIAAALAALALATTAAPAQSTPTPQPVTQRASIALLGIPFGLLSGEYERMTSSEISVGAAAGYVDFDDDTQAWGDVKLRYYPNARGPRGFAIGALVGFARVESDEFTCDAFTCDDTDESTAAGATAGVFLDYAWLLGRSKRFYVGTGVGAKRVFGLDDDRDYPEILSASRLQIGFAF